MANISSAEIRSAISGVMKGADLAALSSKKIRTFLEKKFKLDLTSRKQEIDEIIMSFVAGEDEGRSEEENSEEENNKPSDSGSSSSSESEEEDQKPPPKKVKSLPKPKAKAKTATPKKNEVKKEIQENSDSSDDSSENNEIKKEAKKKSNSVNDSSVNETDDAAVARKLQEEEFSFRHRAAKKLPKVPRKKRNTDGEPKVRKANSFYSRKCTLSPELAEIMEADEMARPDVVKKMWSIVKERDLLDPANKQFAICDDQLKKLFGTKRVRMFGMMKYLKNHIKAMT